MGTKASVRPVDAFANCTQPPGWPFAVVAESKRCTVGFGFRIPKAQRALLHSSLAQFPSAGEATACTNQKRAAGGPSFSFGRDGVSLFLILFPSICFSTSWLDAESLIQFRIIQPVD